jgi:hypothetical protein
VIGALTQAVAWRSILVGENASLLTNGVWFGSSNASFDTNLFRGSANTVNNYNGAWGTFNAATFNVQSDRSTKRRRKRAKVDTGKLLTAGIYSYERDDTGERHLGLYADELPPEVVSEAHAVEGDDEPLQFIDLYKLTTVLLATVQQLNTRLEALEAV